MDLLKDKHGDDVKICKELMYETTAHGCKNVLSQNRGNFMRFLWFCCVLGMGTGLIVTLHFMRIDYNTYPFNTVVKIGPKPKLPFPMVTICDMTYLRVNRFTNPEAAQNVFVSRSPFGIRLGINKSSSDFIQVENTPLDEAHNISNVTVEAIFKVCIWKEQTLPCNEMWIPIFTDLGKCFALNRNGPIDYYADSAGSHGGLSFIAKIDQNSYTVGNKYMAGLKLKLHDPHQDSRISDSGIFLSPGMASLIAVKKRSYTFLPEPYKAYGDEYCVVNSKLSGIKVNSTSMIYDREACIRSCVGNYVIKECNCRSVTDSEYSSYPMCTVGQFLDCYNPALRTADSRNIQDYNCTCPRVCIFKMYETKLSFGMFPSLPALEIFKKLNIIEKKSDGRNQYFDVTIFYEDLLLEEVSHVPVYSLISIMGIVGGQMGLFIGASFITVAEFLEIFLLFLWSKVKRVCCRSPIGRIFTTNSIMKDSLTVKS